MESLLVTLAVLACPVGMGLMMSYIRGHGMRNPDDTTDGKATKQEIARMRTEIEQLKAERRDHKAL
ncbi:MULTISPECIES: hypothetical protein [Nocardia]|uniref:hypothetical protein n=1 Tax=Nocardia TaxID=1817 RepID=UPI0003076FC5|nr:MULTISPECIES: hypothetical protein [Nocardia]